MFSAHLLPRKNRDWNVGAQLKVKRYYELQYYIHYCEELRFESWWFTFEIINHWLEL